MVAKVAMRAGLRAAIREGTDSDLIGVARLARAIGLPPAPGRPTYEEVQWNLLRAGRTLGRLRDRTGPRGYVLSAWRDALPEPPDPDDPNPLPGPRQEDARRPLATPLEIDHMDWVIGWLRLIPDDRFLLRRIVALRMLYDERRESSRLTYRHLSESIRASHQAVRLWHQQGLTLIQRGLNRNNSEWDRFSTLRDPEDGANLTLS